MGLPPTTTYFHFSSTPNTSLNMIHETQSNLMVVFSVCILATLGMLLRARSDKWDVFDFYIMLLIIVYKKT